MLLKIIRKPLIYSSSFVVQMRKTEAQRGKLICSRSHSKSVSSTFSQTRSNEDSHYMTSTSQPSLPAALGWIGAGTNTLSLEDTTVKGVLLPGCSWCLQRGVPLPTTHSPMGCCFLYLGLNCARPLSGLAFTPSALKALSPLKRFLPNQIHFQLGTQASTYIVTAREMVLSSRPRRDFGCYSRKVVAAACVWSKVH